MSDYLDEIRANIARAEEAERRRIARLVKQANAGVDPAAAEREAAEQAAEQERERARVAREQQREQERREAFERSYLAAGGNAADLDEAYRRHRLAEAERQMQNQQLAMRAHYQKTF